MLLGYGGMPREYSLKPFRAEPNFRIDYRGELNDEQYAAVTMEGGPALVIAGAGAGKTRTLTYRVAYLLEKGVDAERILLLTFTNKAAREMMARVNQLLGGEVIGLWGGTFHGIGARVLRQHAEAAGLTRDFTILDRADAVDLVRAVLGAMEIDTSATRFPKPELILSILSLATNTQSSVETTIRERFPHVEAVAEEISALARRYAERKRRSNTVDFDDLLFLWLRLLQENQAIRERYQARFSHILVDEYQDTNKLQGALIDQLSAQSAAIMVVGDDSQGIYSWRGAHFANILSFPERYPKARRFLIETNYRSTPEILDFANAVIAGNSRQFDKTLKAHRSSGELPIVVQCDDGREQAAFVAQRILELCDEGYDLSDMAVLYRSHFHALETQLEFTRRNIPFWITSGLRFFEQAHVKDVTSFLKWLANPRDETAFKRLISLLPGIGAKTADKLWNQVAAEVSAASAEPEHGRWLEAVVSSVPKKAATDWANLVHVFGALTQLNADATLDLLLHEVMEGFYRAYALNAFDNGPSRIEDIEQLMEFASQYDALEEFLSQFALMTDLEGGPQQSDAPDDDEKVRLSTVHQAKGLEFRVVFVIALSEGLFPNAKALDDPEGEEEERRLFYVATTRAMDALYLTFPLMSSGGAYGPNWYHPSRFLKEVPEDLFDPWTLRGGG